MPQQWVIDLVDECFGKSAMQVGKTIKHPDGRTVKVISGQYWSNDRISNWWEWQEVLPDGKLGPKEHGYGWSEANG